MFEYKLSPNLELLSLLDPSTTSIDNVSIAPPIAFVVDRADAAVNDAKGFAQYKRETVAVRRSRSEGSPRSSTRGGRKTGGVTKDDVLSSLSTVSRLGHYFVYGFTGLLQADSTADYQRLVYGEGLKNDRFHDLTFSDFNPVFAAVWHDLLTPCTSTGSPRQDIGTISGLARQLKCSKDKSKRLLECYRDIAHIVMQSQNEVSQALWSGLSRADSVKNVG